MFHFYFLGDLKNVTPRFVAVNKNVSFLVPQKILFFFNNFLFRVVFVASCFYFTLLNHLMNFISATVITNFGF